jgi:GTP-binding protein
MPVSGKLKRRHLGFGPSSWHVRAIPYSLIPFPWLSMFIDEAKIRVKAGDGGNGCMAFRREKFVPRGGPSGGDGGRGGDVIMVSSQRHNTLIHFRYNPEHKAQRGEHGMGSNCTGLDGNSTVLQVPVGTSLYDQETGELVHDFQEPDEQLIIAKGGRGGRGNQHFATPTHQAPREHELGRAGEERFYRLELKLLADVGLVGYPNAGKSTLISRISAAKPKIADYPFTTLEPNLGVVTVGEEPDQESFVVADMPGLIEGAHLGSGLGTQFLRHIERTRLLVHLVDVSDASGRPDPVEDFKVINKELASFTSKAASTVSDPFADDSFVSGQESQAGHTSRQGARLVSGHDFSRADGDSDWGGALAPAVKKGNPAKFDPNHPLAHKPMIVCATKIDSANPDKLKKLAAHVKRRKMEFHAISAVTGQGIDELKWSLARHLRQA